MNAMRRCLPTAVSCAMLVSLLAPVTARARGEVAERDNLSRREQLIRRIGQRFEQRGRATHDIERGRVTAVEHGRVTAGRWRADKIDARWRPGLGKADRRVPTGRRSDRVGRSSEGVGRRRLLGELFDNALLMRDTETLSSAPDGREPHMPSFRETARWVASRLEGQGVAPAGTGHRGLDRYLTRFEHQSWFGETKRSHNVVGVLPGDGTTDEAVLITAHLDGLSAAQKRANGIDEYQGANDNASGSAVALNVMETLAKWQRENAEQFKRNVVVAFVSKEEQGMIGSEALAQTSAQLGDMRIVANVNFDMIGRGDPNKVAFHGGTDARSAEQNPIYRMAMGIQGDEQTARIVPGHEAQPDVDYYRRSDQWTFARRGIPAVTYAGELVDGQYHSAKDTFDRLDKGMLYGVMRHGAYLIKELATTEQQLSEGMRLPDRDTPPAAKVRDIPDWDRVAARRPDAGARRGLAGEHGTEPARPLSREQLFPVELIRRPDSERN